VVAFTLYIVLDRAYPDYLDLAIIAEGKRYGAQHLGTEVEAKQRQVSLRVPGLPDQLESYMRDVQIVLQSHALVHPQEGGNPAVAVYYKPDDTDDLRERLEKLL